MDMGSRIRAARKIAGLTQTGLAMRVGTTQEMISRYENGDDMQVSRLYEIARALGVRVSELVMEDRQDADV